MARKYLLSSTSTLVAPTGQPQPITGHELRQLLHGKSNQFRGAVAANLVTGNLRHECPSPVQAARLCDVYVGYVTAALGCAVKHGPRDSTIEKINKVVRKFGVEALMRECDRAAAPATSPSTSTPHVVTRGEVLALLNKQERARKKAAAATAELATIESQAETMKAALMKLPHPLAKIRERFRARLSANGASNSHAA